MHWYRHDNEAGFTFYELLVPRSRVNSGTTARQKWWDGQKKEEKVWISQRLPAGWGWSSPRLCPSGRWSDEETASHFRWTWSPGSHRDAARSSAALSLRSDSCWTSWPLQQEDNNIWIVDFRAIILLTSGLFNWKTKRVKFTASSASLVFPHCN